MSQLEKLINELCPNGVDYMPLKDVSDIIRGERITKKDLKDDGLYPVMSGGTSYFGRYDKFNRNEDTITVAQYGSAGYVSFIKEKFWANDICYSIIPKNIIDNKFLYYYLSNQQKNIYNLTTKAVPDCLPKDRLESIQIPILPPQVQQEIVRILDKFMELIEELTEEINARKQQYEYYRDVLLNKNTDKKSLKQIALSRRSGGTPLKSNKDYYENGTIPWLRTQEVVFNEINKTDCFITELAVQETSAKWIPSNCVIVAISGASAGRCAINNIPLTTNQHCLAIEINPEVALYKYVFYCVCNQYDDLSAKKEGARGDLNSSRILGLEIPIPYPEDKEKSLAEQQHIVDMLDRFYRLCNDISEGLPAEIEARQKQYEYYRDKLLTFNKKEAAENE